MSPGSGDSTEEECKLVDGVRGVWDGNLHKWDSIFDTKFGLSGQALRLYAGG